jgi:hypothetical protein
MSHKITQHPIGSTAASVKAYRNLQYLESKGLIPAQVPSARVAYELANANLAKSKRADALAFDRASKQAIQQGANDKWLNDREANVPFASRPAFPLRGIKSVLKTLLDEVEEFMRINEGRVR